MFSVNIETILFVLTHLWVYFYYTHSRNIGPRLHTKLDPHGLGFGEQKKMPVSRCGPLEVKTTTTTTTPRNPVIFSADDWAVQSPSQQSIRVPLPFSEGDWIPREQQQIL